MMLLILENFPYKKMKKNANEVFSFNYCDGDVMVGKECCYDTARISKSGQKKMARRSIQSYFPFVKIQRRQ